MLAYILRFFFSTASAAFGLGYARRLLPAMGRPRLAIPTSGRLLLPEQPKPVAASHAESWQRFTRRPLVRLEQRSPVEALLEIGRGGRADRLVFA